MIRRYVPKEVNELLVYYLWLVLPFANQLRLLALDQTTVAVSSPFLWAFSHGAQDKKGQYSPWASSHLSDILKREFRARLNTHANIQIWRHAAIAISQRHLKQAKFNKDYDIGKEMTWNDAQACHLADLAGSIYAQGIEEASGHVASARAEYRQLSRARHSWLSFALYLGSRAGACEAGGPGPKSASSSSGLSSKRKGLADLSQNRVAKRAGARFGSGHD